MKKVFGTIALLLSFAACNKVETQIQPEEKAEGITITATLAPKSQITKAVADNGDDKITATWAVGERMGILYRRKDDSKAASNAEIIAVDAVTGAATITFTVADNTADNTPCTIIYPSTATNATSDGVKSATDLLNDQDGTLATNPYIDVRVGAGTIGIATPSLHVTTQPQPQYAIFKFTVMNADASATIDVTSLTATIGGWDYDITPDSATSEFYCALPPIDAVDVYFSATGSDSKIYTAVYPGISFSAGYFYQSTLKLAEPVGPNDPLPGVFSVSAGQTVKFSKGNLQASYYGAGVWGWGVAFNQWDFIGDDTITPPAGNGNTTINGDGTVSAVGVTVDLFGWSTAATSLGIHNSDESIYSGDFVDWGSNATVQAGIGTGWRTLTSDEWTYLLNSRGGTRYCKATVNSKTGLVIFSDSYSHPSGVTAVASANTADAAFTTNSWSGEDWTKLETAGAVFLPAAGYRYGTSVNNVGSTGCYWSSSPNGSNNAYSLYFYSGNVSPAFDYSGRYNGYSVRLVKNQ